MIFAHLDFNPSDLFANRRCGSYGRQQVGVDVTLHVAEAVGDVVVYVHNLQDANQKQSTMGTNPFTHMTMKRDQAKLSTIVKAYDPPHSVSTDVYKYISDNIEAFVEEAITIRNNY